MSTTFLPASPIGRTTHFALVYAPWLGLAVWTALTVLPATRRGFIDWISIDRESNPVELLTVSGFLAAGVFGFLAMRQWWFIHRHRVAGVALAGFAVVCFCGAMEEISWGQHILGFDTPEVLSGINMQNEANFHNLAGIHGGAGKLYLAFVGGAVFMMASRFSWFPQGTWTALHAPAILFPLTFAIFIATIPKLMIEHVTVVEYVRVSIRWMTEYIELMIAGWAVAYGWAAFRRAKAN